MEEVNGSTVIGRSESAEPTYFGPGDTGGAYVAIIGIFPPGGPVAPFHIHPNTDEAFYVAEGEATFLLGNRELTVTAGGFVFVPRGTPHTVWNSGDDAVRGLLVISTGDAEHEFIPAEGPNATR
jgi:quercetin dioxygenase-like cupin family protein